MSVAELILTVYLCFLACFIAVGIRRLTVKINNYHEQKSMGIDGELKRKMIATLESERTDNGRNCT